MSIGVKLRLVIGIMAAVVFIVLFVISHNFIRKTFTDYISHDLVKEIQQINDIIDTLNTEMDGKFYAAQHAFEMLLGTDDKFYYDEQSKASANGREVPRFFAQGILLNGNSEIVDELAEMFSAEATIFVRDGTEFVRVATSITDSDGKRAVGTTLAKGPAYDAVMSGETYIGTANILGNEYYTLYDPIIQGGKVQGIAFYGFMFGDALLAPIKKVENAYNGHGYLFIIDKTNVGNEKYIYHAGDKTTEIDRNSAQFQYTAQLLESDSGQLNITTGDGVDSVMTYITNTELNWVIGTMLERAYVYAAPRFAVTTLYIALGVLGALLLGINSLAIRMIVVRPLHNMIEATKGLVSGDRDLTRTVDIKSKDELGELAGYMNCFIENTKDVVSEVKTLSDTVMMESERLASMLGQLVTTFQIQTSSMENIASNIEVVNRQALEAGTELKGNSDSLAEAGVHTVESQAKLDGARICVEDISNETDALGNTIEKLSNSVGEITAILSVINGIADQTNLLALNAAIEAARAGDAGRGFAVVADEVRKLSENTQKSISEIENIVTVLKTESETASQGMANAENAVNIGVSEIAKIVEEFNHIVETVNEVTEQTKTIALVALKQGDLIADVKSNSHEIVTGLEQSNVTVEELGERAITLHDNASNMKALVDKFKT